MRLAILLSFFGVVACTTTLGSRGDGGAADAGSIDAGRGSLDAASMRDATSSDAATVIDAGVDTNPISHPVDAAPDPVDAAAAPDAFTGLACPGGPGVLDLHLATLHDNPPDLANWPITTTITQLNFTTTGVHVEFSKRDGVGRWPDIMPPGWTGPLEYTLGIAECIDGTWHASAAIQFWYGLDESGGNVALNNQVAMNWYYDGRWGALAGRQPATGEIIGVFVIAGNTRGVFTDDPAESPVMERSNVVLVPMPDVSGAMHSF